MTSADINAFMDRFHRLEMELDLFGCADNGERWWDAVRFEACYFLYDCLTGLTYATVRQAASRSRRLGVLRRGAARQLLFAKALVRHRELLVLRLPRLVVDGERHDVILDPLVPSLPAPARIIDTAPRRYHLPDCEPIAVETGTPSGCAEVVNALARGFDLSTGQADALAGLIGRGWAIHRCQVGGYERLFDRLRPRGVLTVGTDKPLFRVAARRGVPVAEAQHGLIGHGHPAYSYPAAVDPRHLALPSLFLTFSRYWQGVSHYPVERQVAVGTDHLGHGIPPLAGPTGDVMVIAADIYHAELLELTRALAARLPGRHFVYKLHPNQANDTPAIAAAVADRPNVAIGDALTPASRLMADVSHLVAIQSTVVHEALQHGRRVCLLPRHDYGLHADLFDLPAVSVPATLDESVAALEQPALAATAPVFFDPFDPARAAEALAGLMEARA